jgi:hypothetical protein
LQEFSAYYSNRLSYREVAQLVERHCGARLLSDQTIWQLVQHHALQASEAMEQSMMHQLVTTPLIEIAGSINLYESDAAEVVLFDDGIGVKAQKPQRLRSGAPEAGAVDSADVQTVLTDVVVLQTAPGQFEYFSALMAVDGTDRVPIETVVQAKMQQVYGEQTTPVPLVILSDGAQSIRKRWMRTFGRTVTILLDWYHLSHKLRQLMSMIARNKLEKTTHLKTLLADLWHGRTAVALTYLREQVTPRNREKWQELMTYLEKHQSEIVDYERRRLAGKTIGSGRVEKAVDQVIGSRQKHKGKSWRPQGSRALGMLKLLELNGKWQQFWFPDTTIA